MTKKHEPLNFQLSLTEKISYRLRRLLMSATGFPGVPMLGRFFTSVGGRIDNFNRLRLQQSGLSDGLVTSENKQNINANSFESGYGYKDEFIELKSAAYYRSQIEAGDLHSQQTESGVLYEEVISSLNTLLQQKNIKKVVNFGCSYAYVESVLAKQNPDIEFTCIDRSALTVLYNENIFNEHKNLNFHAGDIFEFLSSFDGENALFLHIRTLTLLPQDFVERLYKVTAEKKFSTIAGFEQCGVSYETGQPYNFTDNPNQPSSKFRSGMFIHNYPGILKQNGFEIIESSLLKTNHPEKTFRIAKFFGDRC